ncbi:MAG: hypothetical protein CL760_05540 [Chloroflexi bacterium]|nr:hypothetical protein [Chloroflexota bacterium]|tara:strand:+ start:21264 stop:21953 length:690 start_codon:yes stop_codon:yes gene_type:complete
MHQNLYEYLIVNEENISHVEKIERGSRLVAIKLFIKSIEREDTITYIKLMFLNKIIASSEDGKHTSQSLEVFTNLKSRPTPSDSHAIKDFPLSREELKKIRKDIVEIVDVLGIKENLREEELTALYDKKQIHMKKFKPQNFHFSNRQNWECENDYYPEMTSILKKLIEDNLNIVEENKIVEEDKALDNILENTNFKLFITKSKLQEIESVIKGSPMSEWLDMVELIDGV